MSLVNKKNNSAGTRRHSSFLIHYITLMILLIPLVSATFAWDSLNKENQSGSMALKVDVENATAAYTVYKYDIESNKAVILNDFTNIALNHYDQVFLDRNKFTPLIIRIEVESEHLNENTGGSLTISIGRNAEHQQGVNYSSNVIRFSGTLKPYTITPNGDDYSTFYNTFQDDFYDTIYNLNTSGDSFTIAGSTVSSKAYSSLDVAATELPLNLTYSSSDVIVTNDPIYGQTKKVIVFLYFTYDQSEVVAHAQGIGREIEFTDDLTSITVDIS